MPAAKIKPPVEGRREVLLNILGGGGRNNPDSYIDHFELELFRTTPFLFIPVKSK